MRPDQRLVGGEQQGTATRLHHNMSHTRIYGALSFLVVLRSGMGFIRPVFFAGDASLSRSQGVIGGRCGAFSDLRAGFCASPVARTQRGELTKEVKVFKMVPCFYLSLRAVFALVCGDP